MNKFSIAMTGRLRHGALWKARGELGSNKALAEYLGVSHIAVGEWINMKSMPGRRCMARIEGRLMELTGKAVEDLFPEELRNPEFLEKSKTFEVDRCFDIAQLAESGCLRMPVMPDTYAEVAETKDVVKREVEALSQRQSEVVKLFYGFNEGPLTISEIAGKLNLSTTCVSLYLKQAMTRLRRPTSRNKLRSVYTGEEWRKFKVRAGVMVPIEPIVKRRKDITLCSGTGVVVNVSDTRENWYRTDYFRRMLCPVCRKSVAVATGTMKIVRHAKLLNV